MTKISPTEYGCRLLKGASPPADNPSQFRLFWRPVSENKFIFFTQLYIKDWTKWVQCDSLLKVVCGGSRIPLNQFDKGVDTLHSVIVYLDENGEQDDLVIQVEIKDHRSFHKFTHEELSNFKGETTLFDVEHWTNGEGLDRVL